MTMTRATWPSGRAQGATRLAMTIMPMQSLAILATQKQIAKIANDITPIADACQPAPERVAARHGGGGEAPAAPVTGHEGFAQTFFLI